MVNVWSPVQQGLKFKFALQRKWASHFLSAGTSPTLKFWELGLE